MVRLVGAFMLSPFILPAVGSAQDTSQNCPLPPSEAIECVLASPGAAQVAIIDPETGELLTGEAPAAAPDAAFPETSTEEAREAFSTEGLTEERTETGAITLDLQGRFQSPLIGKIDSTGGVTVKHLEPTPVEN